MNLKHILFAILAFFALSACDPDAGQQEEAEQPQAYGQAGAIASLELTTLPPVYDGPQDINATEWWLYVTYLAEAGVTTPPGLPEGYVVYYRYAYPRPIVIRKRGAPDASDIKHVPPGLIGAKAVPFEVEVAKSVPPGKREETPIEQEPDAPAI